MRKNFTGSGLFNIRTWKLSDGAFYSCDAAATFLRQTLKKAIWPFGHDIHCLGQEPFLKWQYAHKYSFIIFLFLVFCRFFLNIGENKRMDRQILVAGTQ